MDADIRQAPVGVGKTFLAHALDHIGCRRGYSVLALRADKMLKTLKHARLDNSYEAELRKLLAVDVLVVDERPCPWREPWPDTCRRMATELEEQTVDPAAKAAPSATNEPSRRQAPKVGRNDPCPCGSGKKYKKCCLK